MKLIQYANSEQWLSWSNAVSDDFTTQNIKYIQSEYCALLGKSHRYIDGYKQETIKYP
jgi:hypothetical protein